MNSPPREWTWKNVRLDPRVAEALDLRFELELFTSRLRVDPEDVSLLLEVGKLYNRLGFLRDGLSVEEKLVRLEPRDPAFHFQLACSLVRLDEKGAAYQALCEAIDLGFRDLDELQKNPDLEVLRRDPRYTRLLKRVLQRHREHHQRTELEPEPEI